MIEVFTRQAVDAAEKAFREQTPVELFGVFYSVKSINLWYAGRALDGAPRYLRADVDLVPCDPVILAKRRPSAGDE